MTAMSELPIVPTHARIGVAAPASAPSDLTDLDRGMKRLREAGYEVVAPAPFDSDQFTSRPDEARARELNALLRRDDLDLIVSVRGGYGATRLLPLIDYEAAAASRTPVVGYSDITALQWALWHRSGTIHYSGPMVASDWNEPDPFTTSAFRNALHEGRFHLLGAKDEPLRSLAPGEAAGPLLPCTLSVTNRLIGTSYMPDVEGAILVVEDIGEPPYRIDSYLVHWEQSGLLGRLGGIVVGTFSDWQCGGLPRRPDPDGVVAGFCERHDLACAAGLPFGHIPRMATLPVGARARLVVSDTEASLTIRS